MTAPLLALMETISAHDNHAADLIGGPDGHAIVYIPTLSALVHYAGVVTEPDDEFRAMCGDLPVRFVVRPRVPAQRGASS